MSSTKQTVKVSELSERQAIAVKAEGLVDIQEGEQVLVGIKCTWDGRRFVPLTKGFKTTKNIFDYCEPGELVIIKRINL